MGLPLVILVLVAIGYSSYGIARNFFHLLIS